VIQWKSDLVILIHSDMFRAGRRAALHDSQHSDPAKLVKSSEGVCVAKAISAPFSSAIAQS
jgi:hypothetical protein